jgi:hypothetical protein
METRISGTIGPETKQTILGEIDSIENKLTFLINLKAEDRHNLAKMGDKTLAFVTKSLEYAKQNHMVVTSFLDVAEFEKEVTTMNTLLRILKPMRQLLEEIDDTTLYVGSKAYTDALTFYTALKGAVKAGVPGMKTVYDDLQAQLPGRGKGNTPPDSDKKNSSGNNNGN